MPFTAQELNNIATATLDFYIRGKAAAQTIQDKPILSKFRAMKKTFPGGKEFIRQNVKGEYTSGFKGYQGDEVLEFKNPANLRQIQFPWYEMHAGLQITLTELKKAGISIADTSDWGSPVKHSDMEMTQITDLMADKLDDLDEGMDRSFNNMLWKDGSQDSKVFPGITAFIVDNPVVGVVAGLDRATTTWWRNRARTAASGGVIASSPSNQTLTKTLRAEARQLRRYGGRPNLWVAGSGFIEKLESEIHEKGTYTQTGFINSGKNDIGMAAISMRGVGECMYDPTLDDLGYTNRSYMIDTKHMMLRPMEGEDMKMHSPARPHDRFVIYKGVTWTGALTVDQLNCHGVYDAS
jgi:hypothetical protein